MTRWDGSPVPPMRHEALYGDRVVRCFAERPTRLIAMFDRARAERADSDAVVFEGRRWSYAETGARADRLAAGFAAHGVRAGDRVVLLLGNRPEFVFVLLALQRLGGVAVPVGVREQRPGLAYIAGQCGAVAIVYDDELADRVPDAGQVPALRHRFAAADLVTLAGVDPAASSAVVPAAGPAVALAADPADDPATGPAAAPAAATPAETDVAVILYTSGTTGRPKGAMLTHLAVVHSALHFEACMRLEPDDRSALAVPASHVTGLVAVIAAMWRVGGAVVVVPEFKAEGFVRLLSAERITHTLMVPAMYQLCLREPGFGAADLSAWRVGGYGGAPMPVATLDALAERLPGLVLQNAYGATETTSPATLMPAGLTRDHADTVGVALPAADIRVMDDAGRELPAGETGEIWIGGPMVVPGYWADPAATAAAFTAGFWHSGDLGSVDADGFVRIVDRKKDMLNRGGYKIYSVEVENVLMAWPGVVEAAVVGRPCPVLGERVHAWVHAPGVDADDSGLRRHCAERLADYKVPESLHWSAAPLPRNANGKLLKRVLREALD